MKTEITDNENFLCALVFPEYNFEAYLTYIGGDNVKYDVYWNDKPLFSGEDFRPSPCYNQDDIESIVSLLGFITLKKGDTDADYFKNYTPLQWEWTNSRECDNISLLVSDFENNDEYQAAAKDYLQSKFTVSVS